MVVLRNMEVLVNARFVFMIASVMLQSYSASATFLKPAIIKMMVNRIKGVGPGADTSLAQLADGKGSRFGIQQKRFEDQVILVEKMHTTAIDPRLLIPQSNAALLLKTSSAVPQRFLRLEVAIPDVLNGAEAAKAQESANRFLHSVLGRTRGSNGGLFPDEGVGKIQMELEFPSKTVSDVVRHGQLMRLTYVEIDVSKMDRAALEDLLTTAARDFKSDSGLKELTSKVAKVLDKDAAEAMAHTRSLDQNRIEALVNSAAGKR